MDSQKTGAFLKHLRCERNLTQQEVADQLFISPKTVSKWESGQGYPDLQTLQSISIFYRVSIEEILNGNRDQLTVSPDAPIYSFERAQDKSNVIFDAFFYISLAILAIGLAFSLYIFLTELNKEDGFEFIWPISFIIGNTGLYYLGKTIAFKSTNKNKPYIKIIRTNSKIYVKIRSLLLLGLNLLLVEILILQLIKYEYEALFENLRPSKLSDIIFSMALLLIALSIIFAKYISLVKKRDYSDKVYYLGEILIACLVGFFLFSTNYQGEYYLNSLLIFTNSNPGIFTYLGFSLVIIGIIGLILCFFYTKYRVWAILPLVLITIGNFLPYYDLVSKLKTWPSLNYSIIGLVSLFVFIGLDVWSNAKSKQKAQLKGSNNLF